MSSKKASGKKGGSDLGVRNEALQAVVLADSYQTKFYPLTLEVPRCLLPLANTPLIEYTLEFLATTGVGEVFVACCSHADQVEEYIKNSKWSRPESPFVIHTMALNDSLSVGDVMRDLDTKGVIRNDFLLIGGDVVCNIDFSKVLKAHKERKQKDKNAIMTMVVREAGSALHRTRQRSRPGVFILDETTSSCLRYEVASLANDGRAAKISIDAELLGEHENISFRNDLIDCQIDICTVDVPALFTENFDYDYIRSDFVRGVLTSDLLGKTMYVHILEEGYASRVQSIQTYDAVSKDIISRYTYPITPDINYLDGQTYRYQKGHIYKEDGVVLAQSCSIGGGTVIGSGTFIGDGTSVNATVIGRRCKIGKNVKLDGAYIWDDVVIEDNAVVSNSIVASKVVLKKDSIIQPGSVVSYSVVVGEGKTISSGVKVTRNTRSVVRSDDASYDSDKEEEDESDDSEEPEESAEWLVGPDGYGVVFHDSDVEDDEDDDSNGDRTVDGLVYSMEYLNVSDSSIDSMSSSKAARRKKIVHHRTLSTASATTATSEDNDEEDFFKEAQASIERSIMDNHSQDIALLELNTLRMTMNAPHDDVRRATIHALINHIGRLVKTETLDVKEATVNVFTNWSMVLSRIMFDDADQVSLLQHLQNECSRQPNGNKILFFAVSTLYDDDLVEESNIYAWWDSPRSKATEELIQVRAVAAKWVEWLRTAEEESD